MTDILFNKNDYKILEALIERECNSPAKSLTVKQIIKITEMSLSKVRAVISKFLLINYIQEGSKDGNSKTYYFTDEGVNHYKAVFGFSNEDVEDMISSFKEGWEE